MTRNVMTGSGSKSLGVVTPYYLATRRDVVEMEYWFPDCFFQIGYHLSFKIMYSNSSKIEIVLL